MTRSQRLHDPLRDAIQDMTRPTDDFGLRAPARDDHGRGPGDHHPRRPRGPRTMPLSCHEAHAHASLSCGSASRTRDRHDAPHGRNTHPEPAGSRCDHRSCRSRIEAAAEEAQPAELATPALGVPVTTVVGSILGHDHQVPDACANHVIAPRAAVRLLPTHVSNVVPGHRGPIGSVRTRGRRIRLLEELRVAAVPARHGYTCSRMNASTTGASEAPTVRASRFAPRTLNEWSPPSTG